MRMCCCLFPRLLKLPVRSSVPKAGYKVSTAWWLLSARHARRWKVLRVLGNMLQIDGFGYETPEQVRAEILPGGNDVTARLNNDLRSFVVENVALAVEGTSIQRIGEVPIYQADPIVRRAESLQRTRDAAEPVAWMPAHLMDKLGIGPGQSVRLKQGEGEAHLAAAQDDKLPANCVRVASAHPLTAALGGMFGEITVERL